MGKINPVINGGQESMVEIGGLIQANFLLQEVKDTMMSKVQEARDASDELIGTWLGNTSQLYQQITSDREKSIGTDP